MDSFNLDIGSYSVAELRKVFQLPPSYTAKDVDARELSLAKQLESTRTMSASRKKDVLMFLKNAGDVLRKYASGGDGKDPNEGTWAESYAPTTEVDSHVIIQDPNTIAGRGAQIAAGRTAGSGEYPPGWLNPVNVRTISVGLNVDSRFREDYFQSTSSDFTVFLPETQRRVVQMRLSTVEMPMTFYMFSRIRGDATMVIANGTTTGTSGDTKSVKSYADPSRPKDITINGPFQEAWLVNIPDGNYELWQGQSQGADLTYGMNTAICMGVPGYLGSDGVFGGDPSVNNLNITDDIAFAVDRANGRSSFGIPISSGGGKFALDGFYVYFAVDYGGNRDLDTNAQLHLGWQLGFRAGTYRAGTLASGSSSVISEGICMPTGPRYAFISIDDGQKNTGTSLISAFSRSTMDKNIISRFNIANAMDDTACYKPSSDAGLSNQLNRTRDYFGPVDIQRLHIRILDEYGRVLDLNHMDWSMTLTFDSMYS